MINESMKDPLFINKYLGPVLFYFFFNSFLLPLGLLYSTLLTPLLLIWVYKGGYIQYLKFYLLLILPFLVAHLFYGIDSLYYLKSFILLFTVFIFGLSCHYFLSSCHTIRSVFKSILLVNFVLCLIALASLLIFRKDNLLWSTSAISQGITGIRRLQLFTYEPSFYSVLLVPLALYYYIKVALNHIPNPLLVMSLITIPLVLSFSFGVIGGIIIALSLVFLLYGKQFLPTHRMAYMFLFTLLIIIPAMIFLLLFFHDNLLFLRISNVFSGNDSSFKGRTYDSFYLGWTIASKKSLFWGSGLGQIKVLGVDLFKEYYQSNDFTTNSVAIPNAVGETLAVFGVFGLVLRFFFEFYFFIKTRVWENYYRLGLFIFIFIYQFTGSFMMNLAEYTIWILAFHPHIFPEFKKTVPSYKQKTTNTKPE